MTECHCGEHYDHTQYKPFKTNNIPCFSGILDANEYESNQPYLCAIIKNHIECFKVLFTGMVGMNELIDAVRYADIEIFKVLFERHIASQEGEDTIRINQWITLIDLASFYGKDKIIDHLFEIFPMYDAPGAYHHARTLETIQTLFNHKYKHNIIEASLWHDRYMGENVIICDPFGLHVYMNNIEIVKLLFHLGIYDETIVYRYFLNAMKWDHIKSFSLEMLRFVCEKFNINDQILESWESPTFKRRRKIGLIGYLLEESVISMHISECEHTGGCYEEIYDFFDLLISKCLWRDELHPNIVFLFLNNYQIIKNKHCVLKQMFKMILFQHKLDNQMLAQLYYTVIANYMELFDILCEYAECNISLVIDYATNMQGDIDFLKNSIDMIDKHINGTFLACYAKKNATHLDEALDIISSKINIEQIDQYDNFIMCDYFLRHDEKFFEMVQRFRPPDNCMTALCREGLEMSEKLIEYLIVRSDCSKLPERRFSQISITYPHFTSIMIKHGYVVKNAEYKGKTEKHPIIQLVIEDQYDKWIDHVQNIDLDAHIINGMSLYFWMLYYAINSSKDKLTKIARTLLKNCKSQQMIDGGKGKVKDQLIANISRFHQPFNPMQINIFDKQTIYYYIQYKYILRMPPHILNIIASYSLTGFICVE